jgi:DNA replication and repair protein RecF
MPLEFLEINQVRNLLSIDLMPDKNFNVFVGDNGSGKTSILEAIHIIGTGRSFRTHIIRRVINHQSNFLSVFAKIENQGKTLPVGIEKQSNGETKIKMTGKSVTNLAELVTLLPLQIVNTDSLQLLTAGPKLRRQFIDWGLFHVEQRFFLTWKRYQEVLKQRNIALKSKAGLDEITSWTKVLAPLGEELDRYRKDYLIQLEAPLTVILEKLFGHFEISFSYYSGWNKEKNLAIALEESINNDLYMGYTHVGPHRADLSIKTNKLLVQDVLSRGQQKLLVVILRVAQSLLLQEQTNKSCIFLLDDLPSELDSQALEKVSELLQALNTQVFLTGIHFKQLDMLIPPDNCQMFHVKQGKVIIR